MTNLTRTRDALQAVLIDAAQKHGRSSGFVRRESKLTPALFVQSVVLSWMSNAHASQSTMAATAALNNVEITTQAINARLDAGGLSLLKSVFAEAVHRMIGGQPTTVELLRRFRHVRVFDSTTIALPPELASLYTGCGDCHGSNAAMKLHVSIDLVDGVMTGPEVTEARRHDARSTIVEQPLEEGSLVLWDMAYFSAERLQRLSKHGVYWIMRLKHGTQLFNTEGEPINLAEQLQQHPELDVRVLIAGKKIIGRVVTQPLPALAAEKRRRALRRASAKHGSTPSRVALKLCGYVIAITNIPVSFSSRREVLELLRARWQVELLFKLWKSHHALDAWRSQRLIALQCEISAKLIGMLLTHWIMLLGVWEYPDRSIVKASIIIARGAMILAAAIMRPRLLYAALKNLVLLQQNGCRLQKRRKHPSTVQRLSAASGFLA